MNQSYLSNNNDASAIQEVPGLNILFMNLDEQEKY